MTEIMCEEILRVRTTSPDAHAALIEMDAIVGSMAAPKGLAAYRVLRNATYPNEVMLVLRWYKGIEVKGNSELARGLAYTMKKHGLVDLSAWRSE